MFDSISGHCWNHVTKACEIGLFSLTHQLEVKRLLAEVTLCWGVRLQLQAHLRPRLHQPVWGGEAEQTGEYTTSHCHHKAWMLEVAKSELELSISVNSYIHHTGVWEYLSWHKDQCNVATRCLRYSLKQPKKISLPNKKYFVLQEYMR